MEIVLHIGPHKTGTTSIQKFLRKHAKKPVRGIFYPPPPPEYGPGHALLAWQALGLKRDIPPTAPLPAIATAAAEKGVDKLVISAEDFSLAFFTGMDRLVKELRNFRVHLICTFTPIRRRVISSWQEEIKHGAFCPSTDIPTLTKKSPGLQPRLVRTFIEALNPYKATVILAYSHNPLSLLNVIGDVIGLDAVPDERTAQSNASHGTIEVETLRSFNAIANQVGLDPESAKILRGYLQQLFASEAWKQTCKKVPLALPDASVIAYAERLAREFDLEIERLRRDPRVTIHDTRVVDHSLQAKAKKSRKSWWRPGFITSSRLPQEYRRWFA